MKKTTLRIHAHGAMIDIPAYQTNVPGLIVAKFSPTDQKVHDRWALWHQNGYHIRTFKKRAEAETFANFLGERDVDWVQIDTPAAVHQDARAAFIGALAKGN